ncbi:MAG: DNA polymerase III subunit delta [bacterium]
MILFLHGPDTYRSKQRLKVLNKAFQDKFDPTGQSIVVLEGEKLTVEEFRQAASTAGLFTKRRMIVVEDLLGANKQKSVAEGILQALKNKIVPEEYVVIFWEGELPKRGMTDLQKYLNKQKVEEFPALEGYRLKKWIESSIKNQNGQIQSAAVNQLALIVGSDLWRMKNELEKLIAYAQGKPITSKQVIDLVISKTESKIFSFTDALANKQSSQAIKELKALLDDGAHPLAIVQMVARQVTNLIIVQEAAQDAPHQATIAKRLKLHPFVVKKSLAQVSKFTQPELIVWHDRLVELDRQLKNSRIEPAALLENFVLSG